jgi:hypothetical protein
MSRRGLYVVAASVLSCVAVTAFGAGSAGALPPPDLTCAGTFNSSTYNNVNVPSGAVCNMQSDTILGNVTIDGQIYASSLTIAGSVSSLGGKVVQIDSSSIGGNFIVMHTKGGPSNQDSVSIQDNTIDGNLTVFKAFSSATGDELISSNTVHGNETEDHNRVSGDLAITAESVSGDMTVIRSKGLGTKEVDGNSVTGTLTCDKNKSPFEAHGNTAAHVNGPC